MHRFVPVLAILLPGLLLAEILAFIQIHRCMDPLIENALHLQSLGVLTVPHGAAIAPMARISGQLASALLFVLSIGAGLAITTFGLAWASRHLVPDPRWITFPSLGLWAGLLFFVNHKGLVLLPSLWILLIPWITWKSALSRMPRTIIQESPRHKLIHLAPILLLALAALPLLGKGMFIDIRDSLLFSSRAGMAISDAYYRYTLPAAEVIKPLAARQLKTYEIAPPFPERLEKQLRARGWHPTLPGQRPHILLEKKGEDIHLSGEGMGNAIFSSAAFEHSPGETLDAASLRADRLGPFRSLILLCLIPGFPLLLYALFFCPLRRVIAWVFDRPTASLIASGLCLIAGLTLLLPMYFLGEARRGPQKPEVLNAYLTSDRREERLHAIRAAARGRKVTVSEAILQRNLSQGDPAERYWTVTFLGAKPTSDRWSLLVQALDDPQPNVVCKAVESLSMAAPRIGKTEMARKAILKTFRASGHPYVQWYAFQALKRLGPLPEL